MKKVVLLFFIFCPVSILAQKLTGKIVDENRTPISFANVVELSKDSIYINDVISDSDGNFSVVKSEDCIFLKISCIGYKSLLTTLTSNCNLGNIIMHEETHKLSEVIVNGKLPVTRIKGDAMLTSIQNSIFAKSGSANNLLGKIPGIRRKSNGFEVFGKGEPVIYIDGRKVIDISELEQLNSNNIKNVELVSNPGAQYDATVKAVIRIQTIKPKGDGLSYEINNTYTQSQKTDLECHANINYRYGDLDLFGTLAYEQYKILNNTVASDINSVDHLWEDNMEWNYWRTTRDIKFIFGTNYQIDNNNYIGGRYTHTFHPTYGYTCTTYSSVQKDSVYYDNLASDSKSKRKYTFDDQIDVYYVGKLKGFNIEFNFDYLHNKYNQDDYVLEKSESHDSRNVHSVDYMGNQMFASKLLLSHTLLGGVLRFGNECTYTRRKDDYESFSTEYVPTVNIRIKESNISTFFEYKNSIKKWMTFMAGIRHEHVSFKYYQDDKLQNEKSRQFDNFYPNASLNFDFGNMNTLLTYTIKTYRPSYRQLTSSYIYINRFSMNQGNPLLVPSVTHDISLQTSWKYFQFLISYQQKRNAIILWSEPKSDEQEVIYLRPINFKSIPLLNASFTASPIIGIWNPIIQLQFSKQWMDLSAYGINRKMNTPKFSCYLENVLSFAHNLETEIDFSYDGHGCVDNNYHNKNIFTCDLAIRKSFFHDALNAELDLTDMFYKERESSTFYANTLIGFQEDRYNTRTLSLTIKYKFNAVKSKYKGTGAGNSEKKRM